MRASGKSFDADFRQMRGMVLVKDSRFAPLQGASGGMKGGGGGGASHSKGKVRGHGNPSPTPPQRTAIGSASNLQAWMRLMNESRHTGGKKSRRKMKTTTKARTAR